MKKYNKILNQIKNSRKNSSLTFFIGAGVSRLSGVPSWQELVKTIAKHLDFTTDEINNINNNEDFLKIPQMYYYDILKKIIMIQIELLRNI